MDSVIKTLEFIKTHSGCGTDDLDYHIVLDLYNHGYIDGRDVSTLGGHAFKNLCLTILGSEYLDSLKKADVKNNHGSNKSANIKDDWHNKPIGKIFVGVSILIVFFVFAWVMDHYFDVTIG